jgi:hypothetical protein
VNQLPNRLRAVGNNPEGANFTAGFCNRYGNGFAWTSKPTNRILFTGPTLLSLVALHCARAE